MKVLLLGATGAMGRRAATELIREGGLERLTIAARARGPLENLGGLLSGSVDVRVDDFDLLAEDPAAHFSGHDIVISAAGPGYLLEERCVKAAIDARVDYVSLNDDTIAAELMSALDQEARRNEVTVVSGAGMAPGISNLLVALAARRLDEVQEVEISVGASSADAGGPATELHFLAMLGAGDFADSREARSPHPVYLPDPVGWVETFGVDHPEELALRSAYPALQAFRFRVGLVEKAVMDTVRAAAASGLGSTERRRRFLLTAARPLRPLLHAMSPGSTPWTAIRIDVRGTTGSRTRTVTYAVVDRLANLASIPLIRAASLVRGRGSGVTSIDRLSDAEELLADIAARGIRFGELEPHSL
ncbi:MAG: saccharopine dehydrogenase family protein [Actinomycetota bacterium]